MLSLAASVWNAMKYVLVSKSRDCYNVSFFLTIGLSHKAGRNSSPRLYLQRQGGPLCKGSCLPKMPTSFSGYWCVLLKKNFVLKTKNWFHSVYLLSNDFPLKMGEHSVYWSLSFYFDHWLSLCVSFPAKVLLLWYCSCFMKYFRMIYVSHAHTV